MLEFLNRDEVLISKDMRKKRKKSIHCLMVLDFGSKCVCLLVDGWDVYLHVHIFTVMCIFNAISCG